MIWTCKKCWKSCDVQYKLWDTKTCEYCWAYLDFLDEKHIKDDDSDYGRDIYKKLAIIDFAVLKGFWYKVQNIYSKFACVRSLDPSVCYKYFYIEYYKKTDIEKIDISTIFAIWGWNDFLMNKNFQNILYKHFEENPTFFTNWIEKDYWLLKLFNIWGEDTTRKLFDILNLK